MVVDIIDSSYQHLDTANLIPSFFNWLFGNALNLENGGVWGIGLILCVALISFLIFKAYSNDKAMITSSLITWVIALLTLRVGWISNLIFFLSCIYVVYSIYKLYDKQSQVEA